MLHPLNKVHVKFLRLQMLGVLASAVLLGVLTTAGAKPTISFILPQGLQGGLPSFTSITQRIIEERSLRQMKTYSGKRLRNDSLIMIYYHDSTIAVTELGPQKLLLSCELIEIYNEKEGKMLLSNLSQYNRPLEIKFDEMLKLMQQCEHVDKLTISARGRSSGGSAGSGTTDLSTSATDGTATATTAATTLTSLTSQFFPKSPFSIFNGIIPGTKWCGTGDIAENYSDLGADATMDRCCRQHDLCPVKIRAYQNKYDLMNDSLYTKSHCICDDMLFSCLKQTNTSASQLMGSIYFNLVQVPCLASTTTTTTAKSTGSGGAGAGSSSSRYQFRAAKEGF